MPTTLIFDNVQNKHNKYITRDVDGEWSQYVHTVLKFKFEESGEEGRR